jgi:hypothetical protein
MLRDFILGWVAFHNVVGRGNAEPCVPFAYARVERDERVIHTDGADE